MASAETNTTPSGLSSAATNNGVKPKWSRNDYAKALGAKQLPSGKQAMNHIDAVKARSTFEDLVDDEQWTKAEAMTLVHEMENRLQANLCKWEQGEGNSGYEWRELTPEEKDNWGKRLKGRQIEKRTKEKKGPFGLSLEILAEAIYFAKHDEVLYKGQEDLNILPPNADDINAKSIPMKQMVAGLQEVLKKPHTAVVSMNGGYMIGEAIWKLHEQEWNRLHGSTGEKYFGLAQMQEHIKSSLKQNKKEGLKKPHFYSEYTIQFPDAEKGPQPSHVDLLQMLLRQGRWYNAKIKLRACIFYLSEGQPSTILYDTTEVPEKIDVNTICDGPWKDAEKKVKNNLKNVCANEPPNTLFKDSMKGHFELYGALFYATPENRLEPIEDVEQFTIITFDSSHCHAAPGHIGPRTVHFSLVGEEEDIKRQEDFDKGKAKDAESLADKDKDEEETKFGNKYQMSRMRVMLAINEIAQDEKFLPETRQYLLQKVIEAGTENKMYKTYDDGLILPPKHSNWRKAYEEAIENAVNTCNERITILEKEDELRRLKQNTKSFEDTNESLEAIDDVQELKMAEKRVKKRKTGNA